MPKKIIVDIKEKNYCDVTRIIGRILWGKLYWGVRRVKETPRNESMPEAVAYI